jgi:TPR repeat protein
MSMRELGRRLIFISFFCSVIPGCASLHQQLCAPLSSVEPAPIDVLACHAGQDNKVAQLELGKRYESGQGVSKNAKSAAHYYRQAAKPKSNMTYVYSPPVGAEGYGRTLALPNGPAIPGLPEAGYRLGQMYIVGNGVRRDEDHGRALMAAARAAGFAPRY